MYVEPRIVGTNVMCSCGFPMEAIEHTDLEHRAEWIWWRCLRDHDHITRAVPLPVTMACG